MTSGVSITRHYPHPAYDVKPQMDTAETDNVRVRTLLRAALAKNLTDRMGASAGLQTQAALSERAGIAQSHISRIVRKESAATLDMLEALAHALGCEAWELLADSEHTRREAIERMIRGPRVPDDVAAKHLPPAPKHRNPRKPRSKPR